MKINGRERAPLPEHHDVFSELLAALEKAEGVAPTLEQIEARDAIENDLLASFLNGSITLTEYHARDPRGNRLYPGEVEIPGTDLLYRALLFLTQSEAEARELTLHESDHLREANQLGFPDSKMVIRFFKDGQRTSLRPSITLILPTSGDENQIRRNVRAIIEAPEELSDLDKKQLG